MTNLEYLSWFLTDTYGAICFHNDETDGYQSNLKKEGKEIETLAVYFPNRLDAEDKNVCRRLESVAGKEFYERYCGAKGVRLSRLNGSILLACYMNNGETVAITVDASAARLAGGVYNIIQYFSGEDISHIVFDRPNNFCQPIPTNNAFSINKGDRIKEKIESYLSSIKKPIISKENGFYMVKKGDKARAYENFSEEMKVIASIRQERGEAFFSLLNLMTAEDKKVFKSQMGLDASSARKSADFDD